MNKDSLYNFVDFLIDQSYFPVEQDENSDYDLRSRTITARPVAYITFCGFYLGFKDQK